MILISVDFEPWSCPYLNLFLHKYTPEQGKCDRTALHSSMYLTSEMALSGIKGILYGWLPHQLIPILLMKKPTSRQMGLSTDVISRDVGLIWCHNQPSRNDTTQVVFQKEFLLFFYGFLEINLCYF